MFPECSLQDMRTTPTPVKLRSDPSLDEVRMRWGDKMQGTYNRPVNQSAGGQPPVNQSAGGQDPVNQSAGGQPPVYQSAGGQDPVNQSAGGQPPVYQSAGGQHNCRPLFVARPLDDSSDRSKNKTSIKFN
jgi:hypothetical protein